MHSEQNEYCIYQQSIQPMEHDYIYGLYCLALTSFGLTYQLLGPK